MSLAEQRITNALPYVEVTPPGVVVDGCKLLTKLSPNFETYVYGWKSNRRQFGFVVGGSKLNEANGVADLRILAGKLDSELRMTEPQLLLEWFFNPMTGGFESAVSVADIKRHPRFHELARVQRPKIEPWTLSDLGLFIRDIDLDSWRQMVEFMITPNVAQVHIKRWFNTTLDDVERTGLEYPNK